MRTARRALKDIKETFIERMSKGNKSCLENIPKGSPREYKANPSEKRLKSLSHITNYRNQKSIEKLLLLKNKDLPTLELKNA
jgi:hypothetical protein